MILILGGTYEGRVVAERLTALGVDHVVSVAGRTQETLAAEGVRVGGFGGAAGLAHYLLSTGVTTVVDATHPFAVTISANAVAACQQVQVRLIRLERPGWADDERAVKWHWVNDHAEAARAAIERGCRRVLLTVGRLHTLDYAPMLADRFVLARVAELPDEPLPPAWTLLKSRGPFSESGEMALFRDHGIDGLITKDSGGAHTAAKLAAADELGAEVIVVRRAPVSVPPVSIPPMSVSPGSISPASVRPRLTQGFEAVSSVDEVVARLT